MTQGGGKRRKIRDVSTNRKGVLRGELGEERRGQANDLNNGGLNPGLLASERNLYTYLRARVEKKREDYTGRTTDSGATQLWRNHDSNPRQK